ncbi:hypothetical protein ACINIS251_A0021 [Acinetobacter baumannii IS-251]|uniref:Uncharacterized protein n=2 Tax=Acinetobacter baumannii TaxID=470 RepID=A0A3B0HLJ5_ACIBA|nr:hypothetical protein B7L41_02485 [Acinetobacter baumannii]ASF49741.1 hypothetical protein AB57_04920 [Acinetobacter baumannii AB0057]EKA78405.1 hypothetical protein ACINIS58_A0012 [Acinetobacter baumannii IS-58]EKK16419.1 hypothetical protein ACINIS235_A0010 [Acinetobacter baumannii IS-235]EKK18484.1 hypothetical protein ACINIS251_A0021 [Acinetobacter baumannii IS-251]
MELTQNNLQAHFLLHIRSNAWVYKVFIYVKTLFFQPFYLIIYYEQLWFEILVLAVLNSFYLNNK